VTVDRRKLFLVGATLVVAVAVWWTLDAVVVTDEERLEAFVDDVTGTVSTQRIDAALEWVDPATEPVEVRYFGRSDYYEQMPPLRERAHDALRYLSGDALRTLQEGIEVTDDRAVVGLRLLSDRGMVQATFTLRRRGERWLVSEVEIHR